MTQELKNCPLCNHTASLETWRGRKGYEGNIHCNACLLSLGSISYDDEEILIKELTDKWNNRPAVNATENTLYEEFTTEASKGIHADVTNLTHAQAVYYCRHKCEDCPTKYNCSASMMNICVKNVRYLIDKFAN